MDPSFRPQRADHIDDIVLDEANLEVATFDELHHSIHRLNSAAGAVWMLCDGRSTVAEIAAELSDLFGLDLAVAQASVGDAVETFRRYRLLAGPESSVAADDTEARTLAREPDP